MLYISTSYDYVNIRKEIGYIRRYLHLGGRCDIIAQEGGSNMERKWHLELNEARESDIPHRLEPVGYARGITAEKVRLATESALLVISISYLVESHRTPATTLWPRLARTRAISSRKCVNLFPFRRMCVHE